MRQVLINLCTNAAHAMRETGGVLEVRLEPIELNRATWRFVHSRGKLGLFLGGYALDSRCDLRCIIEPRELYCHGPFSCTCCSTSCTKSRRRFRLWFRVHLSCTSPNARSMGLARGQYVGNQSTSNVDDWLTTARRLLLYEYNSYPRPHRCEKSVEPGTWRLAAPRVPETTRCFYEDRGNRATGQWRDAGLPRDSASHSSLAS